MKDFIRQHLSDLGDFDSSDLDVYLMNAHLLILSDKSRQENASYDAWMLQSPYQFFFIGRVETRKQQEQLSAIKAFEDLSCQVHSRFENNCQGFLAQAVACNCYTWYKHKIKS